MTSFFIHHTAEVSCEASIGESTKIWNWTKVREAAILGRNCNVGQCVYIDKGVSLGDDCKIQNGAQLYQGLIIGNGVFIGPNVTFTNDKYPKAVTKSWVLINTVVEDNASIGAGSVILCGVTIGKHALVAAGSVVTKSVPPYALVAGNPARFRKFIREIE